MKRFIPWIVVTALLVVVGCGGGGGGGSTTDGGSTGTYTNMQIGASVSGFFVDPTSVAAGETLSMKVYGRNTAGSLVEVPASSWTTTAPSSVATVSGSGTVVGVAASSTAYTISVTAGGQTLSNSLRVRSATGSKVTGALLNPSGVGMRFASITFYDSTGTAVSSAVTGVDGTFRAVVPTSATQFGLNIDTTDPTNLYYRQFTFDENEYMMDEATCYAPLPTLSSGGTAALGSIGLTLKSSGPPAPPTGCVG